MQRRFLTVILLALLISATASLLLYQALKRRAVEQQPPTTRIVVARQELRVGSVIKEEDVELVAWSGPVPEGAFTELKQVLGRGVVEKVYRGEAVVEGRLAPKGAGGGLAARIPPGMRAFAIRVDDINSLGGFVLPGMRVDVIMSVRPSGDLREILAERLGVRADKISRTLLQNVEVLSAGTHLERDAEGKPIRVNVVNLLVTPEQAEALALVSSEAKIQLVLRNPLDLKEVKTAGTDLARLLVPETTKKSLAPKSTPKESKEPVRAVPSQISMPSVQPYRVEVIHGTTRETATFRELAGRLE